MRELSRESNVEQRLAEVKEFGWDDAVGDYRQAVKKDLHKINHAKNLCQNLDSLFELNEVQTNTEKTNPHHQYHRKSVQRGAKKNPVFPAHGSLQCLK